jgi:hypothetical protein
MGNGLTPGPTDELTRAIVVDEGTLATTESPPPGPIGLDSRTGGSSQGQVSLADQIIGFAARRRGQRVGDGECFTLADRALRAAGARSAADYGSVTPDADYVWGTSIALSELQPGDVIQLRRYRYDRTTVTETRDGETTSEDFQERPHHTVIVERIEGNGAVTVLEQNAPPGSPVVRSQLFFASGTRTSGKTKTTITVRGTFWFYRPEPK